MKTLVTGGTGYLGRRLVRDLLNDSCHVRLAVRPGSDINTLKEFVGSTAFSNVETVTANLCSTEECHRIIDGCQTIYHLAAGLSGATSSLFLNSVVPTRVLLSAAAAHTLHRCVLVSSLAVYGTSHLQRRSLIDELTPLEEQPELRDPYTFAKWKQEQVAWRLQETQNLPLVVVRPGVIYGYERDALSTRVGLSVGPFLVRIGGRQRLPYVFVDHCAQGVLLAGITPRIEGQAFNLIDDELPTGLQILKIYRKNGYLSKRVLGIPFWAMRPLSSLYEWYHGWSCGQIPNVVTPYKTDALWKPMSYSNQRAKRTLKWQPSTDFAEAIQTTA